MKCFWTLAARILDRLSDFAKRRAGQCRQCNGVGEIITDSTETEVRVAPCPACQPLAEPYLSPLARIGPAILPWPRSEISIGPDGPDHWPLPFTHGDFRTMEDR